MLFSKRLPGSTVGTKGWVEDLVRTCADEVGLVRDRMLDEDFLRYCIDALPNTPSGRDTRRQRLIRAMRRLDERGELPFKVDGAYFVLG